MYVQINKNICDQLMRNVVATGHLGSKIHGTKTESSDEDKLFIYYDKDLLKTNTSFIPEMHGWQYKADDVDYNFQEIRVFIDNIIRGENCTDHESIKYGMDTVHDTLVPLFKHLNIVNYKLIKCYLGYANKDIKFMMSNNYKGNRPEVITEYNKRMSHLLRGINYVDHLLNGVDIVSPNMLLDIKVNGVDNVYEFLMEHRDKYETLRKQSSDDMQSGKLQQRPSAVWYKELDRLYTEFDSSILSGIYFNHIDFDGLNYTVMEKTAAGTYV